MSGYQQSFCYNWVSLHNVVAMFVSPAGMQSRTITVEAESVVKETFIVVTDILQEQGNSDSENNRICLLCKCLQHRDGAFNVRSIAVSEVKLRYTVLRVPLMHVCNTQFKGILWAKKVFNDFSAVHGGIYCDFSKKNWKFTTRMMNEMSHKKLQWAESDSRSVDHRKFFETRHDM